jgi:hypothetical protein
MRWHACGIDSLRMSGIPSKPTKLTITSFTGVWSAVSDKCRSHREQVEGPYFEILDRQYVPEGGGLCRKVSFKIQGQSLQIRAQCSVEESGFEPTSTRFTLVDNMLKASDGQIYQKCTE